MFKLINKQECVCWLSGAQRHPVDAQVIAAFMQII